MGFSADPDTPATQAPAIAWLPSLDLRTLTIVRPVPWARTLGDLPYRPSAWGDRAIRIRAADGTHILVRRHGAPELALWVPAGFEPTPGKPFGLYLHPDRNHADRVRAAETFRRAIGLGVPIRSKPYPQAHRQAAMLYLYDHALRGASLLDMAAQLLDPMPTKWRESSERSDLRRLLDAGTEMVAGGYRGLLSSSPAS